MFNEPREPVIHQIHPFYNGSRSEVHKRVGVPVVEAWHRVEDLPDAYNWYGPGKGWG